MPNNNVSRQPILPISAPKDSIHGRVRNTLRMVNHRRGGNEVSAYSLLSRKEFRTDDTVNVILGAAADADVVEDVPKLALLVISTTFRQMIEKKPEIEQIKVTSASIDLSSVIILMHWVQDLVHSNADPNVKVLVPAILVDKAKLIHAAHLLGMSRYVNHVIKGFKDDIRTQTPLPQDCAEFEKYAVAEDHEITKATGERLGYLLRTNKYPGDRKLLKDILARSQKLGKAVRDADARATARRAAQF